MELTHRQGIRQTKPWLRKGCWLLLLAYLLITNQRKLALCTDLASVKDPKLKDREPQQFQFVQPRRTVTGDESRLTSYYERLTGAQKHAALATFYNSTSNDLQDNLWDDPNCRLPGWMKTYLSWHKLVRAQVNQSRRGKHYQYLVMQCCLNDRSCGGLADRLKPLPLMLRVAYYSKRILLIHWSRPAPLTEFLVPPKGGLDWRTPDWLSEILEKESWTIGVTEDVDMAVAAMSSEPLARVIYQREHGGQPKYDEDLIQGELGFRNIFHEVWRIAFTPSLPVRTAIEEEMNKLGLVPGHYTAAHLRALYAVAYQADDIQRNWTRNALNCATELRPQRTIFFTSDSGDATRHAKEYGEERNAKVVIRAQDGQHTVHLDKDQRLQDGSVSDYYDAFVDLYLLGQADCLTYNKGGYGVLGLYISRNVGCTVKQTTQQALVTQDPCFWVDNPSNGTETTLLHKASEKVVPSEPIYVRGFMER